MIGGGNDPGVEAVVGPLAVFSIVAPLVSWGHAAAMVPLVTSISRTSTKGTRAGAGSFRLPLLPAVLGLIVDVPAGVVTLRPPSPSPVGEVRVRGLAVGGGRLDVDIDRRRSRHPRRRARGNAGGAGLRNGFGGSGVVGLGSGQHVVAPRVPSATRLSMIHNQGVRGLDRAAPGRTGRRRAHT